MRPGGGHSKGAAWERVVCKQLSLWVTHGKREDVFWRSSMSGGRATVYRKKGLKSADAACGDVTAILPEGRPFLDLFFVECKATRNLHMDAYLSKDLKGMKQDHWLKPLAQAQEHGGKKPFVILKRDRMAPIVYVDRDTRNTFNRWAGPHGKCPRPIGYFPLYRMYVYDLRNLLVSLDPDWIPGTKTRKRSG